MADIADELARMDVRHRLTGDAALGRLIATRITRDLQPRSGERD